MRWSGIWASCRCWLHAPYHRDQSRVRRFTRCCSSMNARPWFDLLQPTTLHRSPFFLFSSIAFPLTHPLPYDCFFASFSTCGSNGPPPCPVLPMCAPELPPPEAPMPSIESPFSVSGGGAALEERSTPEDAGDWIKCQFCIWRFLSEVDIRLCRRHSRRGSCSGQVPRHCPKHLIRREACCGWGAVQLRLCR